MANVWDEAGRGAAPGGAKPPLQGHSRRRVLWVVLLFVVMALLPFAGGCSGTSSFADDPSPTALTTPRDYPTAYPEAAPEPGDFVLRWDGTLHAAYGRRVR